jgi:cyclohexadienyl dehydratase
MSTLPTTSIARCRRAAFAGLLLAIAAFAGISGPAAAGPRLDRINESKVLRVGTPGDYRPFAIKSADGYSGHDIDLIEQIAKELGAKIEYVPTTWKTLLPDLQADRFDIAVGGITRNVARIGVADMLPGYAPFGKVALVRAEHKDRFTTLDSLNQPDVRVIKNPGGTNEQFVLAHLKNAQVVTHEKNAEIPALIADGKGDVMITETYEALHYARTDPRLAAAFVDAPLTPPNTLGFLLPKDDADYGRVMHFAWELLEQRGVVKRAGEKWLQ